MTLIARMLDHEYMVKVRAILGTRYPGLSDERLAARYELLRVTGKYIETDDRGVPSLPNGPFVSISHKTGYIFIAVADRPIGVDMEVSVPRGPEVYTVHTSREYELLGGKTQEHFYRLWTIKEALVKSVSLGIEAFDALDIVSISHIPTVCSGQVFDRRIEAIYQTDTFIVLSVCEGNRVYGVAYKKSVA